MTKAVRFDLPEEAIASVVVIGWRDAPLLLRCLEIIAARTHEIAYEVVVALNEPSSELLSSLDKAVEGARIVQSPENLGFGGIYNRAISTTSGEFVVLLNDDTEVCEGWLTELVDVARRRSAAAVGSLLLSSEETVQEAGAIVWRDGWTWSVGRGLPADQSRYDYERRSDYCSASSLLVRRSVWDEIGGFDDRYFPAYFEDADLCMRIAEHGGEVWLAPRSRVVHLESQGTNSTFRRFLMDRNHAIFAERWRDRLSSKERRIRAQESAVDRAIWLAMGEPTKILVIDDRSPNASIGSGFARMVEIVQSLASSSDLHLDFFASVVDGALEYDLLSREGVGLLEGAFVGDLAHHLDRSGIAYECVLISRPHNYERFLSTIRSRIDAPLIYDAEALYTRRIVRQRELAVDEQSRRALAAEEAAMRAMEELIASDADFVVCLDELEAEFFRENGTREVVVMPPILAGINPTDAPWDQRSGIGYVAGWLGGAESPNAAALSWFVKEVFPLVRQRLPEATLRVTGANPPVEVLALAGDGVQFVGRVEELFDFYSSVAAVISPMTYGAGVKIKTVEALQHAVPVVATTVGAEGIPLEHPEALLVADDPVTFSQYLISILGDKEAWDRQRALVSNEAGRWREQFAASSWPEIVRKVLSSGARRPSSISREPRVEPDGPPVDSLYDLGLMPTPKPRPSVGRADFDRVLREEYLRYLELEVDRRSAELTKELEETHGRLFEAETALFHERQRSAELDRLWGELANAYETVGAELRATKARRVLRIVDSVTRLVNRPIRLARRIARRLIHRERRAVRQSPGELQR